jgi:hypothetical protein
MGIVYAMINLLILKIEEARSKRDERAELVTQE